MTVKIKIIVKRNGNGAKQIETQKCRQLKKKKRKKENRREQEKTKEGGEKVKKKKKCQIRALPVASKSQLVEQRCMVPTVLE